MPMLLASVTLVAIGAALLLLRRRVQAELETLPAEASRRRRRLRGQPAALAAGGGAALAASLLIFAASSAVYIPGDRGGLVIRKLFGDNLPEGRIVALDGEKGPQAEVLPPGWHFGYWPWSYTVEMIDTIAIPTGQVGVVTAKDGKPLAPDTVFAPEWSSPDDMLDARRFLGGEGYRGPQLTVLPPGRYRYNTALYDVELESALEVPVGSVAVIKANAGPLYEPGDGGMAEEVNGTPIVPNGHRGIWKQALTPNAYYLHPKAFVVTMVSTTDRVYAYDGRGAIEVRTKDGFEFPVDVRVSVKISAGEAPYVVAQFARPDDDLDNTGYTTIEDRAILPAIRAIFRNNAENKGAIEYVDSRSAIEQSATALFREGIELFHMKSNGVFVADIGLSRTEEGKRLLKTQTDKQIAEREVATYEKQQAAEVQRAQLVKAREEALQESEKAKARARVDIAREDARALVEQAKGEALAIAERAAGEAKAWREKVDALGGVDNFVQLEIAKLAVDKWGGDLPSVLAAGGLVDGLAGQAAQLVARLDAVQ